MQGEVLNLMGRLRQELGLTYVIITHNLAMVRHVSDELAVMYLGRVVEQGPTGPSSPGRRIPTRTGSWPRCRARIPISAGWTSS